jgi:hypothetical protein
MANICSNYLIITGDQDQIEDLYKRLMDQDPALIETVPNFEVRNHSDYCILDKEYITHTERVDISFDFGSRWNCPLDEIHTLSLEYPDLEFRLNYEEGGNDYFGEALIQNGSCDSNDLTERNYHERHHMGYQKELAILNDCSYEKFLSEYTHGNFMDEHPYAMIDRNVVARIKDKDLALFISRQWLDDEAKEEYQRRLSRGSTEEPETEE